MMTNLHGLKCFFALALALAPLCAAHAETQAGEVLSLTGTMTVKTADGALKALAAKGLVAAGDTLFTGRDSYARVHFTDGGEVTLRPNTQFMIEKYSYDEQKPEKDGAGFSLLKGSLRALSGLISKRGNKDSYEMKTPAATIGIRGTEYGLQVCNNDCDGLKMADGGVPPNGLSSQVDQGAVIQRNKGGDLLVEAGSFSYVSSANAAPLRVPATQALRIEIPSHIAKELERSAPARATQHCSPG